MKKSLLALAAMGAFAGAAQAQSSVSVYGVMDIGIIDSTNQAAATTGVVTTTKQFNTGYGKGGLASSRLGFRGTEDLGKGMKANFVLEWGLKDVAIGGTGGAQASGTAADATTSTANAAGMIDPRQAFVGLSDNSLGEIRLGRQFQSIHKVIVNNSAGGGNNVAGAAYSGGENAALNSASIRPELVWINRAVTYISPTFSGFQLEVQTGQQTISSGTVGTTPDTSATDTGASLNFNYAKLNASVGYSTVQNNQSPTTGNIKNEFFSAGANYDFGILKTYFLFSQAKVTNAAAVNLADNTIYELGAKGNVANNIVLWASGLTGSRSSSATAAALVTNSYTTTTALGSADFRGYQVGAQYLLSKRSSLYTIVGKQSIKGTSFANGINNSAAAAMVGINHTF
jgi:predicted porin